MKQLVIRVLDYDMNPIPMLDMKAIAYVGECKFTPTDGFDDWGKLARVICSAHEDDHASFIEITA